MGNKNPIEAVVDKGKCVGIARNQSRLDDALPQMLICMAQRLGRDFRTLSNKLSP